MDVTQDPRVEAHELPKYLDELAERYEREIGVRDDYLWKWFHKVIPRIRLSSVDPKFEERVRAQKTHLTFFMTLLDDLADQRQDKPTFEEAANIPFESQSVTVYEGVDERYLQFTEEVWEHLIADISTSPYYSEYRDLFFFDLRESIQAMRYSLQVNREPRMANLTEAYAFGSYNMVMFPYADIDLMHSPSFQREELDELRELLFRAQKMARIGNWVSTWKREAKEGDFSSGVIAMAKEEGVGNLEERQPNNAAQSDLIRAIEAREVPDQLLDEWSEIQNELAEFSLESINVNDFLNGMETVLEFHLGSQGKK